MKNTIRIKSIDYVLTFEEAFGSYYDYATEVFAYSLEKLGEMIHELEAKDWERVETKDETLVVMLKDKHIIRIFLAVVTNKGEK